MQQVGPDILDRIKQNVAETIAANSDEAGEALAGLVLDSIDAAVSDPFDPRPFAPGARVYVKRTGMPATVVRALDHQGEVHTVVVRYDNYPGEVPFSPRELDEVQA